MATDKKITELPAATTPLAGTEKAEIVQGGVNKQVDVSELGGGGGTVVSVTGSSVDNTDTANPVVNAVPLTLAANTTIDGQGNELVLQGGAGEAVKFVLDGVNNTQHALVFKTGGVVRWQLHTDNNETGVSNVGSDFHIERFDDAGAYIDNPLIIDRTDGVVDFNKAPTITTAPAAGASNNQVPTTAWVQDTLYDDVKLSNRVGQILAPSIYGSGSSIPLTTVVGGLTLTLGTEVFTISAGSNGTTFVNYVQFNAIVTSLSKYKIYSQVTTGAADANSRGYYVGLVDVQAGSGNDMVFHFDSSSGANAGLALIYHNGTLIAQSPTAMTTFASAALLYEVIRDKDTYTFTVLGPSNEKVVATYTFNLLNGTVIKPGCSKFILGSLSTQNRNVYNFRVESDEIVYSDVLYVGDSITNGYYAGSEANSFPRLMEAEGKVVAVSASNGAQTIDVFLWTADFYLVKPKKAVLMIGTNDAIGAVAQFTFGVRHWNIYNALRASGADVWVVNLPPISTTDVTAYNTTLSNRYGQTGRFIDVYALLKDSGTDWNPTYGSNSHPNQAGHLLIHQTILAALYP